MTMEQRILNVRQRVQGARFKHLLKRDFLSRVPDVLRQTSSRFSHLMDVLRVREEEIETTIDLSSSDEEIAAALRYAASDDLKFKTATEIMVHIGTERVELPLDELIPLAERGGVKRRKWWGRKDPTPDLKLELARVGSDIYDRSNILINAFSSGKLRQGDFRVVLEVDLQEPRPVTVTKTPESADVTDANVYGLIADAYLLFGREEGARLIQSVPIQELKHLIQVERRKRSSSTQ